MRQAGPGLKRAMIFGASGQDAYYLTQCCRRAGVDVFGFARSAGPWVQGDVGDTEMVFEAMRTHRPHYVFHLAACSTTRHDALFDNHRTIAGGTWNVLEGVRKEAPAARVFLAGSGLQFVNAGQPIAESAPFCATSPYAVSRIAATYAARYFRTLGLRVYVGYLFHHESPLRKSHHVSRLVSAAAVRIAGGSGEHLELGDISVEKEWTFAGDVAEAIWLLVNQDVEFEAIIGSGTTYSIRDWVERCFAEVGLDWRRHVRHRENFQAEYPRLVSDPGLIRRMGWQPRLSFHELARLMMRAELR